jgi:hypothetical protein
MPAIRTAHAIKSGHRGNHCRQHRHGMRVVMEALEESKQSFQELLE